MDIEQARKKFPPMWTIYDHPRDYPDKFVVRLWHGPDNSEPQVSTHETLGEARQSIVNQGGSGFLSPSPGEDPCIVETWI